MTHSDLQAAARSVARLRVRMDDFTATFYQELLALCPALAGLFDDGETLRRKLVAMLSILGKGTDPDTVTHVARRLGERHAGYGVAASHYQPLCEALLVAVESIDAEHFDVALESSWRTTLAAWAEAMRVDAEVAVTAVVADSGRGSTVVDASLYEAVGGSETITRVHQRFYADIFADPWLGAFFGTKSQESLVLKQTRFMAAAFGGKDEYIWESPAMAHMHMFVTDEQADIREALLRNAIRAEGLPADVEERWLRVDQAFRPAVVKQSIDECVLRCPGQMAVTARRPAGYKSPVLQPRG